jgi:hypothetical protein
MEIEIITTKKKLTQSIIKQMYQASTSAMRFGIVLGHIKLDSPVAIIKHLDDYYKCHLNYCLGCSGNLRVYRKVRSYSTYVDFASQEELDVWWSAYQAMREKALLTHIYI